MWLLVLLVTLSAVGQQKYIGYFEPVLKITYPVTSNYKQSFSIANRNVIQEDQSITYKVQHVAISHLSEYQWATTYAVGFGIKYRFRNTFDAKKENELRLQEQFVYTYKAPHFHTTHRLRTEQRMYSAVIKHRVRYQLGYKIPFNNQTSTSPYIKTATESVLEVAKTQKPELEQRWNVLFGWWLSAQTFLQFGAEYQLADYAQNLYHELFFIAELNIKL